MKIKYALTVSICLLGLAATVLIFSKSKKDLFNNKMDSEYEQLKSTYESMYNNLKMLKTYEKAEQELLHDINELNVLQHIYQEELIDIINDILKSCHINTGKIAFSEVQEANLSEIKSGANEIENANNYNAKVQTMTVSIEFTSNYDNLIIFIDKIQNRNIDISITNVSIFNTDGGDEVQCVITLNFYAVLF